MKRALFCLLVLLLSFSFIIGCGNSSKNEKDVSAEADAKAETATESKQGEIAVQKLEPDTRPQRTALTAEDFTLVMETGGYTVYDFTDTVPDSNNASKVLLAENGKGYYIEFRLYSANSSAEQAFKVNYESFNSSANGINDILEDSYGSYNYYSFSSDSGFAAITRIGNTFIVCGCPDDNKTEVLNILKKLGYAK